MLARLMKIRGVVEARVDSSGTHFLVGAADAAALEQALPTIREVLGDGVRRVDGVEREAQLARRDRGDPWFSADDVRGLSYIESRVLSTWIADAVSSVVPLEPPASEELLEAIRVEVVAALDEAHDTGGRSSTGWFWKEWPRIAGRISARVQQRAPRLPIQEIERALLAQGSD